ncbi:MAG: hypothetical protein HYT65_00890 [Candidatus Yanofskybacteria bacterium]|nr:hypothetical protein [Candidatus Yanofskybacteria bacterium]
MNLTNLLSRTTYFYQIFSDDAVGNQSTSSILSFTTTGKPQRVSNLKASAGSVILTWTNPDDTSISKIVILRSAAEFPFNPALSSQYLVNTIIDPRQTSFTDTTAVNGTTYYYAVFTVDAQGVHSDPVFVTFPTIIATPPNYSGSINNISMIPSLDLGSDVDSLSYTVSIRQEGSFQPFYQFTQKPDQGIIRIPEITLASGNYDILVSTPNHLARKRTVTIKSNTQLILPTLLGGDLNRDRLINSLDFSAMRSKWFKFDISADLNGDGYVNSLDWGILSKNWNQSGDE